MTTWQRRLRIALGVFILLFAGGLYLAMRRQPPPPPPVKAGPPVDPKVQLQVNRGIRKAFKGGKIDYTIEYETILEYTDAATIIRGAKVTFPDRNGRTCVLQGDKATVAQDQSTFTVNGHVQFTSSDGLVITTEQASYTKAEDVVRAPGKADFTRGSMRGSGTGLTYDQQHDVIAFTDQFEMNAAATEGHPPSEAHSGSMLWTRTDRIIRLERAAKIVRGGQTLEADVAMLYLTDDEQHLKMIQLQGNSHIEGTPSNQAPGTANQEPKTAKQPPGTGDQAPGTSLRRMQARDISLTYGEDGETLRQSILAGGAQVEVRSAGTGSNTRIAGEFVDFGFEADGSTMRSLAVRGAGPASPARLDIPAQGDVPRRVIRAASMQGPTPGTPVTPGRGMTTLRCSEDVVFNEAPAPPAELRTATSRILDLVLEPGFGAVQEARFSGSAHLKQGTTLEASARDARYDVKAGSFEFTGSDDQGGRPSVKDQDATIRATHIVVRPDSRKVSASGAVQTTIQPAQKRPDGTVVRTPGILSQDEPTLASSDALEYDGAASHAVFRSKSQSKLWQSKGNSILAVEITVDDAKGDLAAKGSVSSVVKLEQTDTKTKRKEVVATTIAGDEMAYEDASHRATYTGHVQMKGGAQGDMKTDRAVLFLTADGSALDRLEGYGHIDLEDPGTPTTGRRKTTGDRVTYTAADEHWVVTGKLVKMSEECMGESEGRKLEFWRSIDKMVIDGNAERRTQSKGGPGCKK